MLRLAMHGDRFSDLDFDFGHDADGDLDFDFDAARDEERDFAADGLDLDEGFGTGSERDDAWQAAGMPMTRRDIDALYNDTLRGTRDFLKRRAGPTEKKPDVAEIVVGGAEVLGGAMLAAYLAQRFRMAGALVPVGVTTGILLHIAAYYGAVPGGDHTRRFATGLIAGAGALWAAGRGSLLAEGRDQPQAQTGGMFGLAGVPQPAMSMPMTMAAPPAPVHDMPPPMQFAAAPPPGVPMTLADLQALAAVRRAA